MSVPGRIEAAALLLSLRPPEWFLRHSRAVAEVSGWLAARIVAAGTPLDRRLVEAAALLHDVDKLLPADDPAAALPHGTGSAAWLTRRGHPELGAAVAAHPVTRLLDDTGEHGRGGLATLEERVVAYADKRAGQRLESLDVRFASWRRRYPPGASERGGGRAATPGASERGDGWAATPGASQRGGGWDEATFRLVRQRADRLEADVCAAAGVRPEEVRRLAWTGRALRAARARSAVGGGGETARRRAAR